MLANHSEGFAVQRKVAGLGLEAAAVPPLQTLPRKTSSFFLVLFLQVALKSLLSPWATLCASILNPHGKAASLKPQFQAFNSGILDKKLV